MTSPEKTKTNQWYDQLLLPDQRVLVDTLFPFKTPSLEVSRDCLVVADSRLQPSGGYHDTSSNIFLSPRPDKKLLIPAEAFGRDHPEFDLHVIVSHTLPVTHRANWRRWAVWCSRIPYKDSKKPTPLSFTPELARAEISRAKKIKEIYQRMLNRDRDPVLQGELKELMSRILQGSWFRYYTDQLPNMIYGSEPKAEEIVAELFAGLEGKIGRAIKYWEKLMLDDQKLLASAFRVVVKTKFSPPFAYLAAGTDEIRKNELTEDRKLARARDPLEIVARTQGVSIDEVEAIYIPDDVDGLEIYPIIQDRLESLGLAEKVRPFSELDDKSKYPTCDAPYGRFDLGLLAQYIKERKIVPLVPSEWNESDVLK